jgi:hypothetical protein
MVLLCKRVECSAKIAMTTLRGAFAAMGLLPNPDITRLIFLWRKFVNLKMGRGNSAGDLTEVLKPEESL